MGVAGVQDIEKLLAERVEAFVIKVADKDDSRRVIGRIIGESVTVPTEELWELVKQDALACIRPVAEVLWNTTYAFIWMNIERMVITDDFRDKDIECLLPGLVFNEDLKMHPFTSRPDNRCTKGHPAANLRPPCS